MLNDEYNLLYTPEDQVAEKLIWHLAGSLKVTIIAIDSEENLEQAALIKSEANRQGLKILYLIPKDENSSLLINPLNLKHTILNITEH